MREFPDLPYVEPNRTLIEHFQLGGTLAAHATPFRAGRWELRAHPDVVGRMIGLAPVRSCYSVYGVPCVAAGRTEHAVAALVAIGMDMLLLRLPTSPASAEPVGQLDGLGPAQGWHLVWAWSPDSLHEQQLRAHVETAYDLAHDLSARLTAERRDSGP